MKNLTLCFLLALSMQASAQSLLIPGTDLEKRPPAFAIPEGNVVFIDIKNAYYEITYDHDKKKASIEAYLSFQTAEAGMPVIDSLAQPTRIELDGKEISDLVTATPDKTTVVRVLKETVEAGLHEVKISLPLEQMVEFTDQGVKNAFWMGDLEDRSYLERYLPTNFVFDRVPMILRLKYLGGNDNQRIYTNGFVEKMGENDYKVTFPENLNITCPYFHTVPKGTFLERSFEFTSIDGRKLPSVIYIAPETVEPEAHLTKLQDLTTTIMNELEADYGPFPHESLTIYNNAPSGGMEYSGATITSESALGHELFHSYFARGVLPANGNAGWIDEALARWRDNGYKRAYTLTGTSRMANLGTYDRLTDRLAYSFGSKFMAMIDGKTEAQGGLKPFLRYLVKEYLFNPITTEDLVAEMNKFYGIDFSRDFKQYLYGEGSKSRGHHSHDDSIHQQFSEAELKRML